MSLYKIVGSHYISEANFILKTLRLGQELKLVPEHQNLYDKNAIGIWIDLNPGWQQLGYLPKEIAAELYQRIIFYPNQTQSCNLSFAADGSYMVNLK